MKIIEYLEATGGQYIDSGFIPNSKTKIEFEFSNKGETNGIWFGAYPSNGEWHTRSFGLVHNHLIDMQFWMHYCSNTNATPASIIYTEGRIALSADGLYLYDMRILSTNRSTFTADNTMYIFNGHGSDMNHQPMAGRIHYFKIFESNVLVRDFIPVVDENNVPCFYDNVTETYFYNIGTGSFIPGPIVSGYSERYAIHSSTLTSFADQARRISGETGVLSTAQMLEIFEGAGNGGMENGYNVSFYDEDNQLFALFSIKQGEAIYPSDLGLRAG